MAGVNAREIGYEVRFKDDAEFDAAVVMDTTLGVTGVATFTAAPVFTAAPSFPAGTAQALSGGFTVPTGKTGVITDAAGLTVGGLKPPLYVYFSHTIVPVAQMIDQSIF